MSVLSKPYFHDEAAAFEHLESVLWSDGAICPHCGAMGHATKLQGEAHRRGVWKCNERECRKQFTVKVGTVFEHGRMPLSFMAASRLSHLFEPKRGSAPIRYTGPSGVTVQVGVVSFCTAFAKP